jgi:hypothetical protein
MYNFFDYFQERKDWLFAKWLILGKGPSFSELNSYSTDDYKLFGLNHVVCKQKLDLLHAIDIEVIEDCSEIILENAKYVVIPWIPHIRYQPFPLLKEIRFRPSDKTLEDYCQDIKVLNILKSEGRLLWYNLCTSTRTRPTKNPTVRAFGFSSTAAINLLSLAGIKQIRSLGVDGGNTYSSNFSHLKQKTLLVAGQQNYNSQFQEIANTIMNYKIDFAPLNVDSPIKIYVGAAKEQMLAFKVLEYSILKHASMTVEVMPLFQIVEEACIDIPVPKDPKLRARTPFTFQRFAIPELNSYKGRAIYLDSDMLVFRDIKELWVRPFSGAQILSVSESTASERKSQFSVMVMNCEELRWNIKNLMEQLESGKWTYEEFVYEMAPAKVIFNTLPDCWNDLERYNSSTTALTHFTDMNSQPWLTTDNVNGYVWFEYLFEALEKGFISLDFVKSEVNNGNIRPSILDQIDRNISDPLLLPTKLIKKDMLEFVPPHNRLEVVNSIIRLNLISPKIGQTIIRMYALLRKFYKISGLKKFFEILNKSRRYVNLVNLADLLHIKLRKEL